MTRLFSVLGNKLKLVNTGLLEDQGGYIFLIGLVSRLPHIQTKSKSPKTLLVLIG